MHGETSFSLLQQDCEEAILALITGSVWEEALRLVSLPRFSFLFVLDKPMKFFFVVFRFICTTGRTSLKPTSDLLCWKVSITRATRQKALLSCGDDIFLFGSCQQPDGLPGGPSSDVHAAPDPAGCGSRAEREGQTGHAG